MELTTLYKQYRVAKLAADQAAKEEDKLKKALKKAMEEAGVKNYTDEDGFLFERIVQNRKSMDENVSEPYRRFVIATDNDEAGRKAARRIKDKLIPLGFRFFNLKWLTDLKDVNELIQNYGDDFEDYLHRY